MENRPQQIFINDEVFSYFMGDKYKHDAYMIWSFALLQLEKNPSFIPRAEFLRKRTGLGQHRYRKAIRYLKDIGLVETYPVRGDKGQWGKSQYMFYTWGDRIKYPSPSDSPGPQRDTKAATLFKEFGEGKKNFHDPSKTPSNKELTERTICRQSDNRIIYIQGGKREGKRRGGASGPTKNNMVRFSSSDNEKHIQTFLNFFQGQNTFQTFDDAKKKDRNLSRVYQKNRPLIFEAKNDQGAGIFLTINETDGKGRKKENVIKVRAVFADLDGAPLEPIFEYNPSLVVETSPNRYHAYWITDNVPLEQFQNIQKAIANRFGSDRSVVDLPRVMRVPGYFNNKYGDPFLVKILYTNDARYSFDLIKTMFPDVHNPKNHSITSTHKSIKVHGVNKGQRNQMLCKMVGALIKQGQSEQTIRDKAYQFARTCNPPYPANQIETTLRHAMLNW